MRLQIQNYPVANPNPLELAADDASDMSVSLRVEQLSPYRRAGQGAPNENEGGFVDNVLQ